MEYFDSQTLRLSRKAKLFKYFEQNKICSLKLTKSHIYFYTHS